MTPSRRLLEDLGIDASDLPGFKLVVPTWMELRGDRIVYHHDGPNGGFREVVPGPNLLSEFISLTDATPKRIFAFARRWGMLAHERNKSPVGMYETTEEWRATARRFLAGLSIAARLHRGRPGTVADWRMFTTALTGAELDGLAPDCHGDAKAERAMFWLWVHGMIGDAEVAVMFDWPDDGPPVVSLGNCTLPSALVTQFLFRIALTERIAVCDGCGMGFQPRRRPNPNRRTYCFKAACRRAMVRDAQAAKRQRDRTGKR